MNYQYIKIPKLYFYNRHKISKEDILSVTRSLKHKNITKGLYLSIFENKLKKYFKCKYSLAFSNGTSALFAIAKSLSWNSNDNILVSPLSFVAGANAISNMKANPIFIDIDEYFNLDPIKAEKKILDLKKNKKKVSAIIVTDYGGNPANWKKFLLLKKKYKLILINDNCHSLGSKLDKDSAYSTKFADIVVQSFHAVKNITTAEGGAILTNNKIIYSKLACVREHGFFKIQSILPPWSYDLKDFGYNFRLSELNCALGVSQFNQLNKFIIKRNQIAKEYNKIFKNISLIKTPKVNENNLCSFHLYPLRFNWKRIKISKKNFYNKMKKKYGINLQIHYKPTYKFTLYKSLVKNVSKNFPNTEKFYRDVFSIPLYVDLKKKEINYIANAIIKTIKE